MSIKDHKPFWLRSILGRINTAYIKTYINPHFARVGEGLRIINPRHLDISGPNISVGHHVHFMALRDKPVRLAVFEGLGSIDIGDYSIINPGVRITSAASIKIGHSCMLAMNAYLSDADWHDIQHRIYAPGANKSIVLGNNVWVGDGALVCKGVTIGDNSVVGARAVVTKDVPANKIVAGNPASVVGDIDPNHLTMRKHLFEGELSYAEFEDNYQRNYLRGNSLLIWLRTKLLPRRGD